MVQVITRLGLSRKADTGTRAFLIRNGEEIPQHDTARYIATYDGWELGIDHDNETFHLEYYDGETFSEIPIKNGDTLMLAFRSSPDPLAKVISYRPYQVIFD
jgi:hypothetical protein